MTATSQFSRAKLEAAGLTPEAKALVVGLGKTGLSIARFLTDCGIRFAVADTRADPPGLGALRELCPDAAVFLGEFDDAAFAAATHLIVSPGVPLAIPQIQTAVARGARVLGDVDLFACCAAAPVIGITGSNGKSTVTALLGRMAEVAGVRVRVGGNLGTPMLDLIDPHAELYVLELSSFQLETANLLEPMAATVLNVTPDHMDRYDSLAAYAAAKARVFAGEGVMVLTRDDPIVAAMAMSDRRVVWIGLSDDPAPDFRLVRDRDREWLARGSSLIIPADEVRLRGRHNLSNALAALALGSAARLPDAAMVEALKTFSGLDHRMQWVAELGGVTYINDSKATNVGACIAALSGLDQKAVLIAGGDGKGADFSILRPVVAEKVRAAVLMGKDARMIDEAICGLVPVVHVDNMKDAVMAATELAKSQDTVLLAPACASLDQYRDYQHRGEVFVEAVRGLAR